MWQMGVMRPDTMIRPVFWMLSFKPTFSLSSFTFIKRLFSSSLAAIRVVLFAYLKLVIFLPAVLIPAFASSSPAFLMMYSACKLSKQGDNTLPGCTPFPIWDPSVIPCPVLTVASWSSQISQGAGQVVWYFDIFKNFPQFIVICRVKGFGIANKAEVDVFLEISCLFDVPIDVGNLISGSSAFSKPAWTCGSSWFMYCWSLAWRILSMALLACEMSAIML